MKKYTYWAFAALILGTVIYFISRPELEPQNLPKIQYTQVASPAEFGELIFKKLTEDVRQAPVLFLGVTPDQVEDLEVWKSFLAAAALTDLRYDMIIAEPQLPFIELLSPQMMMDLKTERDRFVEGVRAAQAKGMRVAVIVPTIYSSQLLTRNPADLLKTVHSLNFTSFSIAKYPVTIEQEAVFQPGCSVDEKDREGTGALGCAIRTKARTTYRQKVKPGTYSGMMDKIDKTDYLVLFNRN